MAEANSSDFLLLYFLFIFPYVFAGSVERLKGYSSYARAGITSISSTASPLFILVNNIFLNNLFYDSHHHLKHSMGYVSNDPSFITLLNRM